MPGHEFAGKVVALGAGVEWVALGALVAVDPSLFCGQCDFCRAQRGNLYQNWGAIGVTVDGAFAKLVRAPARNVYELPQGTSDQAGALVEPIACAVHGVRRLHPEPGASVLVTGAGPVGLILLQLLLHAGAARAVVVDRNERRLEVARALGATGVESSVEAVRRGEPAGFDLVVDATGVAAVVDQGLGAARRGGTLLIFGVAPERARVSVSPFRVYNDEVTVIGSMAVLYTFAPAIELPRAGVVATEPLLTHSFPLERFEDALAAMRSGEGGQDPGATDGLGLVT